MGDGEDLPTHAVVQPIGSVGIDEAISRPLSCAHPLVNLAQQFEGALERYLVQFDTTFLVTSWCQYLYALVPNLHTAVESGNGDFSVVTQSEER